ncbi:MAG TPA: outer membrane beta-barrel protein [Longimicrobiales bacterium]|nr:outer membrane beta-barrel protein [Longimicrobiales bacterium]
MRVMWPVRLALPVIMLLAAGPALAQEEERRGFLGLGIGPSAPFGSFADASPDNPRAGRATPGYTDTFVNVGYRFGRRVGVAGAFSYSEYDMRDEEDDDWWQVAGLVIGPMYSHPLGARAALDLKAMLGLLAMTPVVDSYTTADKTGSGLALDMRAAARYDVFRRWAVFAEAGIQSAAVSFDTGVRKDYRAIISGFGIAFRPAW